MKNPPTTERAWFARRRPVWVGFREHVEAQRDFAQAGERTAATSRLKSSLPLP